MARVFINYRREDARYPARQLYDALRKHLKAADVFMDVDSIPPGVDFVDHLSRKVAEADVMLCLIGRGWIGATDATGRRRLDDPSDFVRIEIRVALELGIRVVPVFLDGAPAPQPSELPGDLQPLARRHGEQLDLRTFEADAERLIQKLGLAKDKKFGLTKDHRRMAVLEFGLAVMFLVGVGWIVWSSWRAGGRQEPADTTSPASETSSAQTTATVEFSDGDLPPETERLVRGDAPVVETPGSIEGRLGLAFAPLDLEARRSYGVPDDVDGVIVSRVESGTDAFSKVRVGDVIQEIAWEGVSTPEAATELADTAASEGRPVLLLINRRGEPVFESVRPAG